MKNLLYFSLSILLFISSCTNECQGLLDEVNSAKIAYENSPTAGNCLSYQAALQAYLASSCNGPSNVNYQNIFQSYLDALPCDSIPTSLTCFNGVQDNGETGVDCGGSCAPCGSASDYFISFKLNGVDTYYDANPLTYLGGSSNLNGSGFSQSFGNADNSSFLTFNFAGLEPTLASFQSALNVAFSFEDQNANGYARFEYGLSNTYDSYDSGNTNANSFFKFTSATFYSQNVLFGDTIDNFTVEGEFYCQTSSASDTAQITNGTFKLLFAYFH